MYRREKVKTFSVLAQFETYTHGYVYGSHRIPKSLESKKNYEDIKNIYTYTKMFLNKKKTLNSIPSRCMGCHIYPKAMWRMVGEIPKIYKIFFF